MPHPPRPSRSAFRPAVAGVWAATAILVIVNIYMISSSSAGWRDVAGRLYPVTLLAAAAAGLILAVRRIRTKTVLTDALFPLVLLNPLLVAHAHMMDRTLLGAGLLGLLAAVIVGMHRESLGRYLAAAGVMAALPVVSKAFLLMLPALILWLGFVGYLLARDRERRLRVRGFVVLGLAEAGLILFGVACLLEPATELPRPADLFARIVSFADFPLTVAGIAALALAWGRRPSGGNPPWMAGLLALFLGLLTLMLNNFQSRNLPPPGADQTMVLLCILYAVFALASPPYLRRMLAILLLAAAATYTVLRPVRPPALEVSVSAGELESQPCGAV
jgi:hypothetical protein